MKKYIIGVLLMAVIAIGAIVLSQKNNGVPAADTVAFNGAIEPSDPLPWWFGYYEYTEFAPPDETWVYSLRMALPAGSPRAILNIDGFQTESRLLADVKENGDLVQLIFDNYQVGNVRENRFQKGDILLSLRKGANGNLEIVWGKMKSNLTKPSKAEFKKIDAAR